MKIEVYTDGSCSGNPGIGGYAAILSCGKQERIVRGTELKEGKPAVTTNNRMELMAMIRTIDWLDKHQKEPCEVVFYTDSQYVINCALGHNKDGSRHKVGWFKGRLNEDLWMEFICKVRDGKHTVRWVKVKGHGDDQLNARADTIAKEECTKAKYGLVFKR